jgi:hypothetical protein
LRAQIARISAYICLFWADLRFSKHPLNMAEYLKLAKKKPKANGLLESLGEKYLANQCVMA